MDIQIHAEEILRVRHHLDAILAHRTGQELADVEASTQRDYFMSAKEPLDYGMIDKIMERDTRKARIVDPVRRSLARRADGKERRVVVLLGKQEGRNRARMHDNRAPRGDSGGCVYRD